MKRWQIGYRLLSEIEARSHWDTSGARYNTPYRDLPEFEASEGAANMIRNLLEADFPTAEWRLAECR